jgi:hypothetical protein
MVMPDRARQPGFAKQKIHPGLLAASLSVLALTCAGPPSGNGDDQTVRTVVNPLTTSGDAHRADWDGDGYADPNIFRAGSGQFYWLRSTNGTMGMVNWGRATDWPVLGDYDGDGWEDVTVWRPGTRLFASAMSKTAYQTSSSLWWGDFGFRGMVPVPGDYDGDHKTDVAYWSRQEPLNAAVYGKWHVFASSGVNIPPVQWGLPGDEPVQADYDGDEKTDYAVWRPLDQSGNPSGTWFIWRSLTNDSAQYQWGSPTDIPVPGLDYDQDGKADLTVYRARTGEWLYALSSFGYSHSQAGTFVFSPGGDGDATGAAATDIPVTGAFNDGTTANPAYPGSFGLWRPSTGIWKSTNAQHVGNPITRSWGLGSPPYLDFPVNGQKRVPYVSPTLARGYPSANGNCNYGYESTALAVPPNVASCGASGAAFLSGTPIVYKFPLSCWKSGTNCSGMTSTPLPVPSSDQFDTADQNILRMNNGHILVQHLAGRYEPPAGTPRQGIALFFDSSDCGSTFSNISSINKANFNNDPSKMKFDRSIAFNNPYSDNGHGRVYFTVNNGTSSGPITGVLFYSTDYAQHWTPTNGVTVPFSVGYLMAPSPRQRQYLFSCNDYKPTIHVFSEQTNSIIRQWSFGSTDECGLLDGAGEDNTTSWDVSLISSEEDGDHLRIVYPKNHIVSGVQSQYLNLANIRVTGSEPNLTFSLVSSNAIYPKSPTGSMFIASFIQPDMLELDKTRQANTTLLYWLESDGMLNTGNTTGAGVQTTVKGMVLRDMNLWAPIFPVVANTFNGNPQSWVNWIKSGDYVRGGFAYDAPSDMLQFFPIWRGVDWGPDCSGTNRYNSVWYSNMISAHP